VSSLTINDEAIDKIEKLTFSRDSLIVFKKLIVSCPSDFYLPIKKLFQKGSIDDRCNLVRLSDYFPSASKTLSNYYKTIPKKKLMAKKKISREDIIFAFGGNSHEEVIWEVIRKTIDSGKKILMTFPNIPDQAFMLTHIIQIVKIEKEENVLIGRHSAGIKFKGLYFNGGNFALSKLLSSEMYALVHFAAIIDYMNSLTKYKFELYQKKQGIYNLFESISQEIIDYTEKSKFHESTYEWTRKRFNQI